MIKFLQQDLSDAAKLNFNYAVVIAKDVSVLSVGTIIGAFRHYDDAEKCFDNASRLYGRDSHQLYQLSEDWQTKQVNILMMDRHK